LSNIIRVIKSTRDKMGAARRTHGGDQEYMQAIGKKNLQGRDHLENICKGGRIILKWILNKCSRRVWTGFMWLRIGTGGGPLRTR
jgi:hypothetical protein